MTFGEVEKKNFIKRFLRFPEKQHNNCPLGIRGERISAVNQKLSSKRGKTPLSDTWESEGNVFERKSVQNGIWCP